MYKVVENPAELMLIGNPRRRGGRGKHRSKARRRHASPAQRRARAAFAAMARGRSRARRRAAPAMNPVRHHRRRRHVIARRRFRRNPIRMGGYLRGYVPMLKNATVGASGAILNDIAFGFVGPFLPAMMQTPVAATGSMNPAYYLAKIGTAFALGAVGTKLAGAKAATMVEGALTVTMRDAIKQFLVSMGIAVPMGTLNPGQVLPALPISQNLKKYIGPTAARGGGRAMGLYMVPGSTSSREMMTK